MNLESALKKLKRIVTAVEDGETPYGVLEIAVYGSVARGEERRSVTWTSTFSSTMSPFPARTSYVKRLPRWVLVFRRN